MSVKYTLFRPKYKGRCSHIYFISWITRIQSVSYVFAHLRRLLGFLTARDLGTDCTSYKSVNM